MFFPSFPLFFAPSFGLSSLCRQVSAPSAAPAAPVLSVRGSAPQILPVPLLSSGMGRDSSPWESIRIESGKGQDIQQGVETWTGWTVSGPFSYWLSRLRRVRCCARAEARLRADSGWIPCGCVTSAKRSKRRKKRKTTRKRAGKRAESALALTCKLAYAQGSGRYDVRSLFFGAVRTGRMQASYGPPLRLPHGAPFRQAGGPLRPDAQRIPP